MRAFVDELSSESGLEALTRLSARASSALAGSKMTDLMTLTAQGGLGKSTLLAKFVLDHAQAQNRPFPFAYLDFDHAGIDPERPRQLLIEIARQVGLQFPAAQDRLQRLADDIRAERVRSSTYAAAQPASEIQDVFARFAEILHDRVTFRDRAFLLVLDTLEIVQWNGAAMERLAGLVDEFRRKGLDELRIVASGRADVPELRRAGGPRVEHIELKSLLVKEARQMAQMLGQSAIADQWKASWSVALVGTSADPDIRREPLTVRVAVNSSC